MVVPKTHRHSTLPRVSLGRARCNIGVDSIDGGRYSRGNAASPSNKAPAPQLPLIPLSCTHRYWSSCSRVFSLFPLIPRSAPCSPFLQPWLLPSPPPPPQGRPSSSTPLRCGYREWMQCHFEYRHLSPGKEQAFHLFECSGFQSAFRCHVRLNKKPLRRFVK